MNTSTLMTIVNVFDTNSDRQAQNLNIDQLGAAVTPWFVDWDDADVKDALERLDIPTERHRAAQFLGLDLRLAA